MANRRELLEEILRILKGDPAGQVTPPTSPDRAPASKLDAGPKASSESPAEAWLAERSVDFENLSAGELANVIEGLTPSGKDKRGRQVSFVEKGVDMLNPEPTILSRGPVQLVGGRRWWRR